jgi:glycerophosphoryl diester phosphodiesterase
MQIVAHRGFRERYPENTLSAFHAAVISGADSIEMDVHMTADGVLVVHHDYYLGGTNNGSGLIYERTFQELKALDAGVWFSPFFEGETIPTLEEVVSTFRAKIKFEIELKGFGKNFLREVERISNLYSIWESAEFTSPPTYLLQNFALQQPKAKIGTFIPSPPEWMEHTLAETLALDMKTFARINVFHLPKKLIRPEFVKKLQAMEILVHWADCNLDEDIEKAIKMKVDQISTDRLERAVELRKQAC